MLRFTPEQELAVNSARDAFNLQMLELRQRGNVGFAGNASIIPMDAWRRIDRAGIRIQRSSMAVYNRLALARTTPIGIGDIVSYFGRISDSGEAHVSLDGRSEGKQDAPIVNFNGTPVPVIDSWARFGWRQMAVIEKSPWALDTVAQENAQRRVAEKLEDMAINGLSSIVVGGQTIYGLRNFPDRRTVTHGLGNLASATGTQLVGLITSIAQQALAANQPGRITFFVNEATLLSWDTNEFVAGYPKTVLARLKEISKVAEFIPSMTIPANELMAIADLESGRWGSILSAMPPANRTKTRVNQEDDYVMGNMAISAPQFTSDYALQSPIVHAS